MKFLVENAKEFADIFLFLFFNECHLCYHDLKVKGISWASCSCRKQNIQPQMAEMIRQFTGLYKSKGQNNWLQVLLVEGLQLYHERLVPSVYFSGPPLQWWLHPGAVSLLMVTRWPPSSPPRSKSRFRDLASLKSSSHRLMMSG